MKQTPRITGTYRAEVTRHDGSIERYYIENDVVDTGLNLMLDRVDSGLGSTMYIGLIVYPAGTLTNADTLASHSGWTESTDYAGSRQAWSPAAASSQKVTNAASPAEFTMDAVVTTIYGCFLATVASGTSGTLFSTGQFQQQNGALVANGIAFSSGDVLKIIYELEALRY
jgi:hypothetical protein